MKKLLISIALLSLLPIELFAETAEEKGLAIAVEADRRDLGWQDSQAAMEMTLRNRQGDSSTRKIRNRSLEVQGDGDKSLTIFDYPADVKNTAFLSFMSARITGRCWSNPTSTRCS